MAMSAAEDGTGASSDVREALDAAAIVLRRSQRVAVLTGAGISAESGLATFRGRGGWWRKLDPSRLATPEAFAQNPKLVWEWYEHRRAGALAAHPNEGHRALAAMEAQAPSFSLTTQNVDGLHQRAGSNRVIELHGNLTRARCTGSCGMVALPPPPLGSIPPRCTCGQLLRPDVVWFGEALPQQALSRALEAAQTSDVFLVVGTSAAVYPAADLPRQAIGTGSFVIEVNPEPTPLSPLVQLSFRQPAAAVLPLIVLRAYGPKAPAS